MLSGAHRDHVFHVPEGTEGPCTQLVCVLGTKRGCISLLPTPAHLQVPTPTHLQAWLLPLSFITSYYLTMCSDCIIAMLPLHFWNMNMPVLYNIRKCKRAHKNKSFHYYYYYLQEETTVTIFCTVFCRHEAHSHAVCACCKCHPGYHFFSLTLYFRDLISKMLHSKETNDWCQRNMIFSWSWNDPLLYSAFFYLIASLSYFEF